jgi:GTPase SAR1 family protein
VIGESSTGKTSLMTRFVEDKFTYSHMSTIGIDFKIKKMQVEYSTSESDYDFST